MTPIILMKRLTTTATTAVGSRNYYSCCTTLRNDFVVIVDRSKHNNNNQQQQRQEIVINCSRIFFSTQPYNTIVPIQQKLQHEQKVRRCLLNSCNNSSSSSSKQYFSSSSSGGNGGDDDKDTIDNNKTIDKVPIENNNNINQQQFTPPPPVAERHEYRIIRPKSLSQQGGDSSSSSTSMPSSLGSNSSISSNIRSSNTTTFRVGTTSGVRTPITRYDDNEEKIDDYYPRSRPKDDGTYKEPEIAQSIYPDPQYRLRPNTATIYPSAPMFPGDFTDYDDVEAANTMFDYDPVTDRYTTELIQASAKTREQRMDKYELQHYPGQERHDQLVEQEMNKYRTSPDDDDDDDDDYYDDNSDDDDDDEYTSRANDINYDDYSEYELEEIFKTDKLMRRYKLKNDMIQAQRERWITNSLTPERVSVVDDRGRSYGHGGRKTSSARVWIQSGYGEIIVNKRPVDEYFDRQTHRGHIIEPFIATETIGMFDVQCTVAGGGKTGQAGAIRHGIARALNDYNPDLYRPVLKYFKLLTRDNRQVERKKIGHLKARKSPQWVRR